MKGLSSTEAKFVAHGHRGFVSLMYYVLVKYRIRTQASFRGNKFLF